MNRIPGLIALLGVAGIAPAGAYYHFIHYINGQNVPEKFELAALPDKTVTFFVSENGPAVFAATDTFNSVLGQIRQATRVWNNVPSSDLRVAFGGLENAVTPQNTPSGDVVFEDLPPGVYGYGGPTSLATPVTDASGASFVPILRSAVHLNRNLTFLPGPSYRETFLMTAVHEMGHALGLQHTFTSATMSQATTRSTTLSRPIELDDVAGISVLYPAAGFSQYGSITGRITSAGKGVHLASVVAIRAGSGAISALTNPDGTFRIDGVLPGQYFVYSHSLPPDADIHGPWNADGSVNPASGPTNTLFYPGTTNLQQAAPVSVQAGKITNSINISLTNRSAVSIYNVQVYSYFRNNTIAVEPAFVNMLAGTAAVSAVGTGLGSNGQAPGLNVQILGGSAYVQSNGILPLLGNGYTYIALYIGFSLGASPGPQHLVFTTPDYMYVLPSGITITQKSPPTVTGVAGNPDGTVTVTGTDLSPDSLIYFDGLPASVASIDAKAGTAVVTPPVGASGQTATVTIYNTDGQNSQILQSASPVTWSYGNTAAPLITSISPSSLPAGAEAAVDITGSGFDFTSAAATVGFGTSDVVVRRVFVLAPDHLRVNVSVSPNAALANPDVSVIAGFQTATAAAGFQIAPQVPGLPAVVPVLENGLPGLTGAYPGAIVSIYGKNLAVPNATPVVAFNSQPATILYSSPVQINLQIPASLTAGTATLSLNNGVANAWPVLVNIDTTPSGIGAVQNSSGTYIDATHPAHQGDLLIVGLTDFAPAETEIALNRVQVGVGGTLHNPVQVTPVGGGVWQVSFLLNANESTGTSRTLIVYLDGRSSYPATIPVAHPDGTFTSQGTAAPDQSGTGN